MIYLVNEYTSVCIYVYIPIYNHNHIIDASISMVILYVTNGDIV